MITESGCGRGFSDVDGNSTRCSRRLQAVLVFKFTIGVLLGGAGSCLEVTIGCGSDILVIASWKAFLGTDLYELVHTYVAL